MSKNQIENDFETRLNGAVGDLIEEEQLIIPPAYLRQRVMEDFERHFIAVTERKHSRRKGWNWTLPWQMNWSFQRSALAAGTLLMVAGLGLTVALFQRDRLSLSGTGRYPDANLIGVGSSTIPDTNGVEDTGEGEPLTPSVFDQFALQRNAEEDFSESYQIYDELHDPVDAEFLIYLDVPADQLALHEIFDPADSVEAQGSVIARLAVGDDGMVRAIQVPVNTLPQ